MKNWNDLPVSSERWQSWSKPKRVVFTLGVEALVIIVGITLIVGFTIGKAHATCTRGSEPTCPTSAEFANKYSNGFFDRANGMPVGKMTNFPGVFHDTWITKYKRYYNNHPNQQKGLAAHATATANRALSHVRKTRPHLECFFPLTLECMAVIEFENTTNNTNCLGWNSWPNVTVHGTCDRFRQPTNNQEFMTKTEILEGLALTACTAGTGLSVVTAIGSGGAAAPVAFAALSGTGCVADFWLTFH